MRPVNEREQAFTYIIVFALFLKQSAGALMNVMAIYHQLRTVVGQSGLIRLSHRSGRPHGYTA